MAKSNGNYHVNGEEFATKDALTKRVRQIRDKYLGNKILNETDAAFIRDLLTHHTEAAEKAGIGLKHFTVEKNRDGTDSFYITRTDGSRDDFSFKTCITNIRRM
ncbi:DCL family protein [Corallococcus interemptor]|uniref:DCL family protein n=1 Tax=Corallococcus interemptor TaxID=2316720 RepID=UPI003CFEC6D7